MNSQSFRFARSQRLLKSADFQQVFVKPYRVADAYFTILAKENSLKLPRLGLAISKKQVRRAVDRNRIKRLARESFRNHQLILPGTDIIVLARQGTFKATNRVLLDSLSDHWKSLHNKFSLSADS